ncbi:MAG: laccase domain-containing protein [Proteobacteria bacterium]|nr:laccase domain-containing protein [Pseudomonadota bacterium]
MSRSSVHSRRMTTEIRHSFGTRENPRAGLDAGLWERLRPRWRQVHGIAVARVSAPGQDCGEADALWTTEPGLPIAVVTADCVPVLLERKEQDAVAAIHAGWRGTRARIADAFFRSLPDGFSDPRSWRARIGPCIRACCYEVSPELVRDFTTAFPGLRPERIEPATCKLDLVAVNRFELERLGVEEVTEHPDCTFCARAGESPRYYSYRRGDRDSRQFSVISIHSGL